MLETLTYQTDLYSNPFNEINANDINSYRILDLWCTPFETGLIKDINEKIFATQRLPIILQGFRGSGKTMILKYFSYSVQKERAKTTANKSVLRQIIEEASIGFYFRCDNSLIKTFSKVFYNENEKKWINVFEHYFELKFCKQLLNVLCDILIESEKKSDFIEIFVSKVKQYDNLNKINSFERLVEYVNSELSYIDYYKNNSAFFDIDFNPSNIFDFYSLSKCIIESINFVIKDFQSITYLLLIDEFENLPKELQKYFNTLIKFTCDQISFRIGRRSEGIVTTETINDEYLRENHDYILAKIGYGLDKKSKREYFNDIAKKRLKNSASFCKVDSITDILGDKENLEEECLELSNGRDAHLRHILSSRKDINEANIEKVLSIISYPSNPIAESLNALWVIRNKKNDPITAAEISYKAMVDYFDGNRKSKYKSDYSDKYRYSITCLIASVYKKQKQYYGFNTICYLSDGNTRTFINICKTIFSDAYFYEKDSFMGKKVISKHTQNNAICAFANSEFNSICSIIERGNSIRNLVLNIGNIFSEYHRDKLVRYPETNQFVFNKLELSSEDKNVIDIAENWSMIIKRDRAQRVSVSLDKKGDIYYINRAFCPIFGISYRIRGGFNVKLEKEELENMMKSLNKSSKLNNNSKKNKEISSDVYQISLFDGGGE